MIDRFADFGILAYDVPNWDDLSLKQKKLAYFLAQAALCGRDITWDQNCKYNLRIRHTLEAILEHYEGDRSTAEFAHFVTYTKSVWFSNGIHHHYTGQKIKPQLTRTYFDHLIAHTPAASLPEQEHLAAVIFDLHLLSQKRDAVNFYEGLTKPQVEAYFADKNNGGLNSKKINIDGAVHEEVYSCQGLYKEALEAIVGWLKKACECAENESQRQALEHLIRFYETGDLRAFDDYNVAWVQETASKIDAMSGFLETYSDPLAITGTFESLVWINDSKATQSFETLAREAKWFERHAPIRDAHKREVVVTPHYEVGNVIQEIGDAPAVPMGLNFPNSPWIQARYGTKSVLLGNIVDAQAQLLKDAGLITAFYLPQQQAWLKTHGALCERLHIALHEVIGHSLGCLEPTAENKGEALKQYTNTIDEARADLVALYFIGDAHLVAKNISPTSDVQQAAYTHYITHGLLVQLARLEPNQDLAEAHMQARHLIAQWVFEKGDGIVVKHDTAREDGIESYFEVRDFMKLRTKFGELLCELQRIKSQGDYDAAKALVEGYGVKVNQTLHEQVKRRFAKLQIPPYIGYVHPHFELKQNAEGAIVDVLLNGETFTEQMLRYSKQYGFLS